jgi:diguanylate cyclase (GGDEF)-like protein/PAS domain S-box-containing protein
MSKDSYSQSPIKGELPNKSEKGLNSDSLTTTPIKKNCTASSDLLDELRGQYSNLKLQKKPLIRAKKSADQAATAFTECQPIGYLTLNRNGDITCSNLAASKLLGMDCKRLEGKRLQTFVAQTSLPKFNSLFTPSHIQSSELSFESEISGVVLSAIKMDISVTDNSLEYHVILTAISERTQAEKALEEHCEKLEALVIELTHNFAYAKEEKGKRADELVIVNHELSLQNEENQQLLHKLERAASVFMTAHESIIVTDATGVIVEVNDAFSRTTGYSQEEVLGKNPKFLQSGLQSSEFYSKMWDMLLVKGHWQDEIWNRRKNGEIYPEMMTICAVKSETGTLQHCVSLGTDITEVKAYQQQLEHIAQFDVLTSLPNRVLLADRLRQAMVHCKRSDRKLAVAFMDLDGFKEVNDKHGHDMGDKLLIAVSHRMKASLRGDDTLARFGGDEFIAVIADLEYIEESELLLQRLLKAAAEPIMVDGTSLEVSASIGVSIYPQDGADADQLIRHADQAMYVAKQEGKNRYRLYDNALANSVKAKLASLDAIRSALVKSQFVLHYQPKVNMYTGEVVGVEALIRWQRSDHSLVPPLDFLPVTEGHAISLEIGEWVIASALTQISQWQGMGINLPISVNISAYQLQQENFTTRLAALLSAHPKVQASHLELEILETHALEDISKVSTAMVACNELGVRFALDDFGTGYSSLTYLKHLPVQLIKIDQSFVRDMLEDTDDLAIVKGVVGLAKAFQRDVIAEGVETVAHGVVLLQLGCELAQGYGIARPMPAADIPKWYANWVADDSWIE